MGEMESTQHTSTPSRLSDEPRPGIHRSHQNHQWNEGERQPLLAPRAPVGQSSQPKTPFTQDRVDMSMTKRYRTSEESTRFQASLIWSAAMTSTCGATPCSAQKSSISWVSAIDPVADPA
jgi:hypothetical protein